MRALLGRLAGFGGLPLISLITPLLVLPVIGRVAGSGGWASLAAGESIGTLGGIVIGYGWNVSGPPRIAAEQEAGQRYALYRQSLVVRGTVACLVLPVVVLLSVVAARAGYELPTALMGVSASVTGLSFAWFCVGAGDPRSIALFEAVPRVAAAAASAALILLTRQLVIYPALAVSVSLVGIVLFSRRVPGRRPLPRTRLPELWRLVVRDRGLAAIDIAGSAYGSVPVPVVNAVAAPVLASSYASGDKLYRFGQFVPITLANAFQSWTVEAGRAGRGRRLRFAVLAHGLLGVTGWLVFAVAGPWVSGLLFGPQVRATQAVCFWLGAAFVLLSLRTAVVRLVLVPEGKVRIVFAATMAGTLVGIPAIVGLTSLVGPVGAAWALVLSEVVSAAVLASPTVREMRLAAQMSGSGQSLGVAGDVRG
ncbi:hypothetical protein CELL_01218 [Cellulomonas sp. T2.31MG-18]|uniref:lipopolysaccharide biosynthesis protein n=1 Tax=Cellulomonas sp. T2.31MG-18 TaxID=3157619 RepID=UPI0035ECC95C